MTSSADLLALQEIDLKRDGRRALIADIDARLGETEAVIAARALLEEAGGEIRRLQALQRTNEDALADLDAKAIPLETKLYSGSVRNPKELSDMQHELVGFKARRSQLDDEGLSLIEQIDAASATLAAAKRDLATVEAEWRADQQDLLAAKAQAESESAHLKQDRDLRGEGMDAGAIGLYEKLRVAKQGRAVAVIERGTCGGCHISLPTHLVQRVRSGLLQQCPSCERILVAG